MQIVGPIPIRGSELEADILAPLATFETPLWPSVNRGARIAQYSGGIHALVTNERMTRSIVLEAADAHSAHQSLMQILDQRAALQTVVATTSRYAQLVNIHPEQIGNLLYLRLEYTTGDASGHNMSTLASEKIQSYLLTHYPSLKYVAISGNMCSDKKVSAINGILGRGKSVITDIMIPRKICQRFLKASPEDIANLHIKKNLLGSIVAGSLRSANAHVANMLLAFYLATGQDAANIVEGSQAIVHTEAKETGLYFSVSLPNIIVGTIGNGKNLPFVQDNLRLLGEPNARQLAIIAAAVTLCGELSLLGAIANPGELMRSHLNIERTAPAISAHTP